MSRPKPGVWLSCWFAMAMSCGATHTPEPTRSASASPSPSPTTSVEREVSVPAHGSEPMHDGERIPVAGSPSRGPSDALVTIVWFGNPLDGFSARLRPTLDALRTRYGDELRIVWKTHPRLLLEEGGPLVAEALMAADAQHRFWPMLDAIVDDRDTPTRDDLVRMAARLQLDADRFGHDLDAHAGQARIDADSHLAAQLRGPDVTPTLFVNGTRVIGTHPVERYVPLIDAQLAAARSMPRLDVYARMTSEPIADPEGVPEPPNGASHTIDTTAVYAVPIAGAPVLGPPDALVTLVAFEDFECPVCARSEPVLAEIRRRYPNDVRIVWRNLPLWVHADALPAAEAAMEVFAEGGDAAFWRFHDALFARRGHEGWLERPALETAAREAGLDASRFHAALEARTQRDRVRDDVRLATRFGNTGTPGFFVNGRMLSGFHTVEQFVAIIDRRLAEARALVAQGTAPTAIYAAITANGASSVRYFPGAPDAQPGHAPEPLYPIAAQPDAPSLGPRTAHVTLDHFAEFEGMDNAHDAPVMTALARAYGDRIRIAWRDDPTATHPHAMLAAEAAREVFAQQGSQGFFRYGDTLFAHQASLERADLERFAAAQHVDMRRFRAALDAHRHADAIRADIAAAEASGAHVDVPATFVNGRLVPAHAQIEEYRRIIDAALAASTR